MEDEEIKSAHLLKIRAMIVSLVFLAVVGILLMVEFGLDKKFLKSTIEDAGLNLLGDFLAGVFAPMAFVGVAAAFYLQNTQLRLALEENRRSEQRQLRQMELAEDQARLNSLSVNANYQLALFDKRVAVFNNLQGCAFNIVVTGTIDDNDRRNIFRAIHDARYVFGQNVNDFLEELSRQATELRRREGAYRRLLDRDQNGGRPADDPETMAAIDRIHEVEQWFIDNLTDEILEERILPLLRLPERIE